MSLSLDTVLQVVDIAQRAMAVYHKIQDGPEKINKIGRRMERLTSLLASLETHLRAKSQHAMVRLRPSQAEDLLTIVSDTRGDCQRVYDLLDRWENNIGPWGLEWRFTSFAQAYFTLGTSSDKLDALAQDIEAHRADLDSYLGLMGVQGIQHTYGAIQKLAQDNNAMKQQLAVIHSLLEAKALGNASAGAGNDPKKKEDAPAPPLPSPSPLPPRADFKIIFVDPYNGGRSAVAAALARLLGGWTAGTGSDWRIDRVCSAGFFVTNRSSCVTEIESLAFAHNWEKLPVVPGDVGPSETAMAALFDNKSYDYPFKTVVRAAATKRKSRGLSRKVFGDFDYIIVFTSREHNNMVSLRQAIVAKDGQEAAPRGRGRIVHLGKYLTLDGIPREITNPAKNADGSDSRVNWNWKVSQMKTAIKSFLRVEMRWRQPAADAAVGSGLMIPED